MALVENRFGGDGLYILDEPEAALSPKKQLLLLAHMERLVREKRSQFLVATHSPILMGYPDALILLLDSKGIRPVGYEETEHYQVTHAFLQSRASFFKHLFQKRDDAEESLDPQ